MGLGAMRLLPDAVTTLGPEECNCLMGSGLSTLSSLSDWDCAA